MRILGIVAIREAGRAEPRQWAPPIGWRRVRVLSRHLAALVACAMTACGGGGGSFDFEFNSPSQPAPSISIGAPTTAPTFTTTATTIVIGGALANASFVHLHNERNNATLQGYVNYFQGNGSWFADLHTRAIQLQGTGPGGGSIAPTPDGLTLLRSNGLVLSAFNASDLTLAGGIDIGGATPSTDTEQIAITPDGARAYVILPSTAPAPSAVVMVPLL